jgi:hypothetical protein
MRMFFYQEIIGDFIKKIKATPSLQYQIGAKWYLP